VPKPTSATGQGPLARDLAAAVRRAARLPELRTDRARRAASPAPARTPEHDVRVIALGAATGGTAALER
jgi:chemotaxis response regulator CheB